MNSDSLPFRADENIHVDRERLLAMDKERLVDLLNVDIHDAKCPECGNWQLYKFVDFCNQRLTCEECGEKYRV